MNLAELDVFQLRQELTEFSVEELELLNWQLRWRRQARPSQIAPDGDWDTWLLMAGRGFGKTRVGAEWIAYEACRDPGSLNHVISPTTDDLRKVSFGGESGLLAIIPPKLIANVTKSPWEITLFNGSKLIGFSAEEPDRLRGPQCHRFWGDEFAAWSYGQEALDNANMGNRLGADPRGVLTTTPRPVKHVREVISDPRTHLTRGTTYDNKENLPAKFFRQLVKYEGTRLGEQELKGTLLDLDESSIFRRDWFRLWPKGKPFPAFDYIVSSWDTAFTEKDLSPSELDRKIKEPDWTAWSVWGVFRMTPEQIRESVTWKNERREKPLPDDRLANEIERCSPYAVMMLDAQRDHLGFPDLRAKVLAEAKCLYGPEKTARRPDVVLVENKGSGISLLQELRRANVPALEYNPQRESKMSRAHMVAHLPASGLVWLPESEDPRREGKVKSWIEPWLDEMCEFSALTLDRMHDDWVDSACQAWRLIADENFVTVDPVPEPPTVDYHDLKQSSVNPYAL